MASDKDLLPPEDAPRKGWFQFLGEYLRLAGAGFFFSGGLLWLYGAIRDFLSEGSRLHEVAPRMLGPGLLALGSGLWLLEVGLRYLRAVFVLSGEGPRTSLGDRAGYLRILVGGLLALGASLVLLSVGLWLLIKKSAGPGTEDPWKE
ncbi:MAG: hypothetical protein K6T17_05205 [Fimbriimonadales bacterium]|nr:hypothetical protein [Fimbriimonadales bacterium]